MKRLTCLILFLSVLNLVVVAQKSKTKIIPPKPQLDLPAQWSAPLADNNNATGATLKDWWKVFNDAQLEALLAQAIQNNRDLKIAASRVSEARAALGISKANQKPGIGSSAKAARQRNQAFGGGVGFGGDSGLFQLGFDANWELDLFGGVQRGVESAQAEILIAEEARHAVLVTVIAEVARNYAALRGLQKQLAVTRANLATQKDTLHLTEVRQKAGLASELDVTRAEAQLARTEAVVPELETVIAANIHRLGVLLGQAPEILYGELVQEKAVPLAAVNIPPGLPSELLRRRPDVRRAEAEILAQSARLGVAKAEMYPKFSLTGLVGRQANSVGGLSLGVGNLFSIGPSVRLPIFTAGRIKSNIAVQDERLQQAILAYENVVLRSLEEVENALTAFDREKQQNKQLALAVASSKKSVTMARELYTAGLTDFLAVLEAQNNLYSNENELAVSDAEVAVKIISLYKALGGGW